MEALADLACRELDGVLGSVDLLGYQLGSLLRLG